MTLSISNSGIYLLLLLENQGIVLPKEYEKCKINLIGKKKSKGVLLMAYGSVSLEKRIKNNVKNYSLGQLLDLPIVQKELESLHALTGAEFLFTRRHGEVVILIGEWEADAVDVIANPGIKFQVSGRTIGHFYYKLKERNEDVETMIYSLLDNWKLWAEQTYLYKETDQFVYEVQFRAEEELNRKAEGVRTDALTGVLTHTYFRSRMKVLDRSQVAPIAALCININDWKFANDHFGDEESDRLIRIIANILQKEAKPEYVIGRVDGDVFNVMIPMPEDGEAVEYARAVQNACNEYVDKCLAPSVAIGIAVKENVEEFLSQVFSDAEYEMFENKMNMKKAPGYQERLRKGL